MKLFRSLLLVLAITLAVESCKKSKTVRRITNAAQKVGKVAGKVVQVGTVLGAVGRMDGESMEEDEEMDYKIEKAAFTLCGNENDNALTWDEVEMCEVSSINKCFSFVFINVLFQEKYLSFLSMELPTEDDFNFYDVNGDGILTMDEWEEIESKAMEAEAKAMKAKEE